MSEVIVEGPRENYNKQELWYTVSCGEWMRYIVFSQWLLARSRVEAEYVVQLKVNEAAFLVSMFDRLVREDRDW